ncbi:hypothetical protein AB1Y20_015324 [Prymnesium parvum]|uniref:Very-long-chain (3R)-3-hydroxyacyl-CoA dehydratase n=1 Tax=Prymnesium parvum TaxID=97485 RepID=A0AB34JXH1_PRYPA|mmetsp:Transcript_6550/g.10069  ORF Transcript_6550/g.10069 Transcript_6550/m.10069 type:complete len:132 (+) Transcript_6550:7-402(+)
MTGLTAMQCWLAALALYELPLIVMHARTPLGGFASNLSDAPSERRLWAFMLLLLVLPRVTAVIAHRSRSVRVQCAAVHIAEAAYFTYEHTMMPTTAPMWIFVAVYINAGIFALWAAMPIRSEDRARERKSH